MPFARRLKEATETINGTIVLKVFKYADIHGNN